MSDSKAQAETANHGEVAGGQGDDRPLIIAMSSTSSDGDAGKNTGHPSAVSETPEIPVSALEDVRDDGPITKAGDAAKPGSSSSELSPLSSVFGGDIDAVIEAGLAVQAEAAANNAVAPAQTSDLPPAYDEDGNPTNPEAFFPALANPQEMTDEQLLTTSVHVTGVANEWRSDWIATQTQLEQEAEQVPGDYHPRQSRQELEEENEEIFLSIEASRSRGRGRGRARARRGSAVRAAGGSRGGARGGATSVGATSTSGRPRGRGRGRGRGRARAGRRGRGARGASATDSKTAAAVEDDEQPGEGPQSDTADHAETGDAVDAEEADIGNTHAKKAGVEKVDSENADNEEADVKNTHAMKAGVEKADGKNADNEDADVENTHAKKAGVEKADVENASVAIDQPSAQEVETTNKRPQRLRLASVRAREIMKSESIEGARKRGRHQRNNTPTLPAADVAAPAPKRRGRPPKNVAATHTTAGPVKKAAPKRKREESDEGEAGHPVEPDRETQPTQPAPKRRGRPPKRPVTLKNLLPVNQAAEVTTAGQENEPPQAAPKKRGRPPKVRKIEPPAEPDAALAPAPATSQPAEPVAKRRGRPPKKAAANTTATATDSKAAADGAKDDQSARGPAAGAKLKLVLKRKASAGEDAAEEVPPAKRIRSLAETDSSGSLSPPPTLPKRVGRAASPAPPAPTSAIAAPKRRGRPPKNASTAKTVPTAPTPAKAPAKGGNGRKRKASTLAEEGEDAGEEGTDPAVSKPAVKKARVKSATRSAAMQAWWDRRKAGQAAAAEAAKPHQPVAADHGDDGRPAERSRSSSPWEPTEKLFKANHKAARAASKAMIDRHRLRERAAAAADAAALEALHKAPSSPSHGSEIGDDSLSVAAAQAKSGSKLQLWAGPSKEA